jgi:hypothetical protein
MGYSGKPLVAKLGIKAADRAKIDGAPRGYASLLVPTPRGVTHPRRGPYDFIQLFAHEAAGLRERLLRAKRALDPAGMLWVSWPKRSSGIPTDVDESVVRRTCLSIGLVDVKVCAIDAVWSGLKFVVPLKDRPRSPLRKSFTSSSQPGVKKKRRSRRFPRHRQGDPS